MGGGRWTASNWSNYNTNHVAGKSTAQVFTATSANRDYLARDIAMRESCDSADNPNSTPIILAADVTGSMGRISDNLMRVGLNTLVSEIYDRGPVSDPHVMGMAIGDMYSDSAPLQCTQFEADIRVAQQIKDLWIEGHGGGNGGESYSGAHLFAGMKTKTDAFAKRGRKGYLFTVGDEPNHDGVTKDQAERHLGIKTERDLTAAECLAIASRSYEVFHVVLANEGYAEHRLDEVLGTWKPILPERTILLDDYTKLAELVVSLIQVTEGANKADVAASWGGGTSLTIASALGTLATRDQQRGVRRFGA